MFDDDHRQIVLILAGTVGHYLKLDQPLQFA